MSTALVSLSGSSLVHKQCNSLIFFPLFSLEQALVFLHYDLDINRQIILDELECIGECFRLKYQLDINKYKWNHDSATYFISVTRKTEIMQSFQLQSSSSHLIVKAHVLTFAINSRMSLISKLTCRLNLVCASLNNEHRGAVK